MGHSGQFQKGNKLWALATNPGVKKRLTPQEIWDHFCDYIQMIDDNPWTKTDYKGKDAEPVVYEYQAPYSWNGFDNYLFANGVIHDLEDYRYNYSKTYDEFIPVCDRISKIIYDYKMAGATLKFFDVGIIAKELGLISKQEIASTVNVLNLGGGIDPENPAHVGEYQFKPDEDEDWMK